MVKALAKGQMTIPSEFREILGVEAETLLSISLVGDHLEITPLAQNGDALKRYTEEDITRFLAEDKLDPGIARRVREVLQRGTL